MYAYCANNPVMYYDPNGNFAISTFLIMLAVGVVAGGTVGGISAAVNDTNVFEGIGKGMLVGGFLAGGVGLTIAGLSMGIGTIGGSMMFGYGASVTANLLEVAVTQGKKSHFDGDSFSAGMNDVINAMFANSGTIAAGNLDILGVNIMGTRILSKSNSIFQIAQILRFKDIRIMEGGSMLQALGVSALSYLKNPAGPFKWFGYGLAGVQVLNLGVSIFTTPDFQNSKWILY